jgi:hypothetical protein
LEGTQIHDRIRAQDQTGDSYGLSLSAGGKYDSYIVKTISDFDTDGSEGDTIAYGLLSGYWQHKAGEKLGVRLGYSLYADFHNKFSDYNIIEHLFSIEPQWLADNFIYSLPLRYSYAREDNRAKYHRYAAAPTLTWIKPDSRHAFEFYGTAGLIDDVNRAVPIDEDARLIGGGIGYLMFSESRSFFRLSCEYNHIGFDARGRDYRFTETSNKRRDEVLALNALHNIQITSFLDFNVNYAFIHTNSNVTFYDYDKFVIQAGITARF